MNTKTSFGVAAAAVLILAGCATTSDMKPTAAITDQNFNCLTGTAGRIPTTSPSCAGIGRSYSSEDINRNGATSIGQAMRQLDPAITVHQQ
jgi:hypothetical protein